MPDICYLCLGAPKQVKVPGYGITVCGNCWQQAAQGWDETWEPHLFQALQRAGLIIPDRNPLGRLPRCYAPPADYSL